MRKGHVTHVMKSEWKKTRKTPVQLVMMLLVPLLSVLFLSWALSYVKNLGSHYKGAVLLAPDAAVAAENDATSEDRLAEVKEVLDGKYEDFTFASGTREDAEYKIQNGKADVVVLVEEEEIVILYDSSILTSGSALKDANDCADDLSILLENRQIYEDLQTFYPEEEIIDLSTPSEKLDVYLDQLSGVIGMIVFLMMASNAMTLAARTITGEKERQTFDTLVLCPAPIRKILLGKVLILMLGIFTAGCMGIFAAIAGMAIWNREDFSTICSKAGKDMLWLLILVLLLVTATCLIAAIFTIIGSAFAETKKASLFSSAGMVLVSFAAMLPTFLKNDIVKYIPIANWTPVIKGVCMHRVTMAPVLTALAISVLLFLLSMILSSGLWERTSE